MVGILRFLALLGGVLAVLISPALAGKGNGITVTELTRASTTWDGNAILYPKGNEEIFSIMVELAPGAAPSFHCHPVPTLGHMIAGEIEVEKRNGEKKRFRAGDNIMEVMNIWHRGRNVSETESAKFVVFYISQKGVKATIPFTEETKDQCKDG